MGPLRACNYAKRLRQTLAWEVRYGYTIAGTLSPERERWGKDFLSSRWMWTEAVRESKACQAGICVTETLNILRLKRDERCGLQRCPEGPGLLWSGGLAELSVTRVNKLQSEIGPTL